MTHLKKAIFLNKMSLAAKYMVSSTDINGNRAVDVKRRVRSALPQRPVGKVTGHILG
jgi:hypothetical protein